MTDSRPPTYLEKLRIVRGYLLHQLDSVDRWIAEEERKAAEKQRGEQARPPTPDWLLELGLNRDAPPNMVHEGHCHMAGKRSRGISRSDALRWLAEGIPACSHCRPDSELGFLDG
ncbi:DUF6233 domain-containing protein [Streptomyces sp. NPDC051315]|uniref:DUF6233 domain-containing protein n=1 Tax=Streptomyces sp. NPDC051315 TaxID=3365650 RepID=UPI0037A73B0B